MITLIPVDRGLQPRGLDPVDVHVLWAEIQH